MTDAALQKSNVPRMLAALWRALRTLSGDDAYERYLAHWRSSHVNDGAPPLDRAAFFRDEERRKWNGVKRCC